MPEVIVQQTAPVGGNSFQPVNFNRNEFDSLVWNKGYDVFIERAMKCPCKSKGADSHLSACLNCGGTGWFFLNKIRSKIVLSSMSIKTNFREYGEENLGRVMITSMHKDELAFMDRITVINGEATFCQTLFPNVVVDSKLIVSTVYQIKSIQDIFVFDSANEPLVRLTDYTFIGNIVQLNPSLLATYSNDVTISIRYKHAPTYHVIDIPREVMNSQHIDSSAGQFESQAKFPIHAIGERAHYIFPQMSYYTSDGEKFGNLFDNSYDTSDMCPI